MTHQITIPPAVVTEVMARAIGNKFKGDHRRSQVNDAIIQSAKATGYTATVDLDGKVTVSRATIDGKMRRVRPTFTARQLNDLLKVSANILTAGRDDLVTAANDQNASRLKQSALRLCGLVAIAKS